MPKPVNLPSIKKARPQTNAQRVRVRAAPRDSPLTRNAAAPSAGCRSTPGTTPARSWCRLPRPAAGTRSGQTSPCRRRPSPPVRRLRRSLLHARRRSRRRRMRSRLRLGRLHAARAPLLAASRLSCETQSFPLRRLTPAAASPRAGSTWATPSASAARSEPGPAARGLPDRRLNPHEYPSLGAVAAAPEAAKHAAPPSYSTGTQARVSLPPCLLAPRADVSACAGPAALGRRRARRGGPARRRALRLGAPGGRRG